MSVNSLPKTVTRQRRDCDLNPGPSAPESSTLTTRLPSHHMTALIPYYMVLYYNALSSMSRRPVLLPQVGLLHSSNMDLWQPERLLGLFRWTKLQYVATYLLYCSSISGIVEDCWWLLPSEFCKIHLNVGNGQSREPNVSAHFRYLPGLVSESKLTRCCFSCVIFTVYSARWLGRENSPPEKNLQFPPNGRQIVCSSFFGRDNELPLYHVETFF